MFAGGKIYFISDRDDQKRFNLYSYDIATKESKQVTHFTEFDIKFPSLGKGGIVFENGGYIYKFDLATEKVEKISIKIQDDHLTSRGGLRDAGCRRRDRRRAVHGSVARRDFSGVRRRCVSRSARNGDAELLAGGERAAARTTPG